MTMGNTFAIVMTFVGFLVSMPALWLLFGALWPQALARAQERITRSPIKTFFAGLATVALFSFLTTLFGQANAQPLALASATFGIAWAFFGVSALARHIGSRMPSTDGIPWRAHLRGAIVLELGFLFPLAGWVLTLPLALVLGSGAATLSLFRRRAPIEQSVPMEKAEILA
jgi:hypothetical protein